MLTINNRTATSTNMSPFFATYGYNVDLIRVVELLRDSGLTPIERGETFVSRL
jgi:hypothetical protein